MQRIASKVNEMILGLCVTETVTEGQRLREDLGFDSLNLTELIIALEIAFSIEFQMEDLDPAKLNTTSDLYALVEKYV